MAFSDAFFEISKVAGDKRNELIKDQIESETSNVVNAWAEKVNVQSMQAEQKGEIGVGFTESQTQWYDQEQANILSQIKDDRIRRKFEQASSNLRMNFNLASQRKEIDFLARKEVADTGSDVNFKVGSMGSETDSGSLEMNFKNLHLGEINRKIDNTANDEMRERKKGEYDTAFTSYVDNTVALLQDEVNLNKLSEEDYKARLENTLAYATGEPDFYRNQTSGNYSQIVKFLRGKINSATEDYKQLRNAKILSNLPGNLQASQERGEEIDPTVTEEIIQAFPIEKREEARITIEAHNATMPYYRAKNEASIPGMSQQLATIGAEVERLKEMKAPGVRLQVMEQAYADILKDQSNTITQADNNFREFARRVPSVKTAETMAPIDPRGNSLIVQEVNKVADQNRIPLNLIEYLRDSETSGIIRQLNTPGLSATDALGIISEINNEWNIPYSGGNARNNVIRQVASKLGGPAMAAFNYYDDVETFPVFWEATRLSKENQAALFERLPTMGYKTKDALVKTVENKFRDFLSMIPDPDQRNSHSDLAVLTVAYVLDNKSEIKNSKGNFITNSGQAMDYVFKEMVESKYNVIKSGNDIRVLVPKEVDGTNYEMAGRVIGDSAFKQSAIDWYQGMNPNAKLKGDLVSQMKGLSPENKEYLEGLNKEKVIESLVFRQSSDGLGVQAFIDTSDKLIPVIFETGEAVIPFNVIQSHRAFIAPYTARKGAIPFLPTIEQIKARKEAKTAIKEGITRKQEEAKIFTNSTTFDDVDAKKLEEEALNLTNESKKSKSGLDKLSQELDNYNPQSVEDLLQ